MDNSSRPGSRRPSATRIFGSPLRPPHKTPRIHRWLARRPRFHLHFTPTSSSWLNLVKRWFALLTEKQLKRGAHRSTAKPFVWTKTADEILASVARFCHRISGTGH
jgi:hypothetical protein